MEIKVLITSVEECISNGNTDKALLSLNSFFESGDTDQRFKSCKNINLLLNAQFKKFQERQLMGSLTGVEENQLSSDINGRILEMLDMLGKIDAASIVTPDSRNTPSIGNEPEKPSRGEKNKSTSNVGSANTGSDSWKDLLAGLADLLKERGVQEPQTKQEIIQTANKRKKDQPGQKKLFLSLLEPNDTKLSNAYPLINYDKIRSPEQLSREERGAIAALCTDDEFLWYEKVMTLSCLTISLMNQFDVHRFQLLIHFLMTLENMVWQRALTGLVLSLYKKDVKITRFASIMNRIIPLQYYPEVQRGIEYLELAIREHSFQIDYLTPYFTPDLKKDFLDQPQYFFLPFFDHNPVLEYSILHSTHNIGESYASALTQSISMSSSSKYLMSLLLETYKPEDIDFIIQSLMGEQARVIQYAQKDPNQSYESIHQELVFSLSLQDYYQCSQVFPDLFHNNLLAEPEPEIHKMAMFSLLVSPERQPMLLAGIYFEKKDFTNALNQYLEIAKYSPESDWLNGQIGYCYQQQTPPNFSKALEYHLKGVALNATDTWNIKNVGYCYQNLEEPDFEKALQYHLLSASIQEADGWNLKNIGFCYQNLPKPDFEQALHYHLRSFEVDPYQSWNLRQIGYCYQKIDVPDFAKALEYHLKAYELDPNDAWNLKNIGYSYQRITPPDYEKALQYHLLANDLLPDDAWNLKNIGYCYQQIPIPNFDKAIEFHLKAVEKDPNDAWNLRQTAYCFQKLSHPDFEKSLEYCLKAFELAPENAWNLANTGYSYQNLPVPNFEKALEFHMKAVEQNPADSWNLGNIGYCYQKLPVPDYQKALEYHLKAVEYNPQDAWNLKNIGYCYQVIIPPDYEKALEYQLKSYEITPDDIWNTSNIAFCYQTIPEPDFEKSIAFSLKVKELSPNDGWNLNNLGYAYLNEKKPELEKALETFLKANEIMPNDIWTMTNISICYRSLTPPDYESAVIWVKNAEKVDPDSPEILENLGHLNIILKKYKDALTYYEKNLTLGETPERLMELGFVETCMGRVKKAEKYYIRSAELWGDKESMLSTFDNDLKFAEEHEIPVEPFLPMREKMEKTFDKLHKTAVG